MNRTLILVATCIACTPHSVSAAKKPDAVLNVWPKNAPGETGKIGVEGVLPHRKGRRRVKRITNVTTPTLALYKPPADKANGCGVVICPGGGYNILAYDLEGTEVAEWLNSIGVTAVVLKYRVPRRDKKAPHKAPLQDAQRAMRLTRLHAKKWGIDPNRLGLLGFSAGGHLTVMTGTHWDRATYKSIDDADKLSMRPDFLVPIYAAYLADKKDKSKLSPLVRVHKKTPPTFLSVAWNDATRAADAARLFIALKEAGVKAELHIYSHGGHGYGLRKANVPAPTWPKRCEEWMRAMGFLNRPVKTSSAIRRSQFNILPIAGSLRSIVTASVPEKMKGNGSAATLQEWEVRQRVGDRRFNGARRCESLGDELNQLPRRGCTSEPRVATSGSAPWVTVQRERQPQRGCTTGDFPLDPSCGTPLGFNLYTHVVTQGGAAPPLTLGCVVKPLRGSLSGRNQCRRQDSGLADSSSFQRVVSAVAFFGRSSSGTKKTDSANAIKQLRAWLKRPAKDRPPIAKQPFASVALTKIHAKLAGSLLWSDYVVRERKARAAEMKARVIKLGKHAMKFDVRVFGKKKKNGRSLYISMHGGGGAPKRVNDQQWENQKRLYRPKEGVYVAPRAPTNTWNLWHQGHIDPMFDRLIQNMVLFHEVDPNRVYLMGYSAGGDGCYQLAPRMADRWAAAAMMAGHPNDASPLSLRNIAFAIHVGELDRAYKRNAVAKAWGEKLAALRKADPKGYTHYAKIHKGRGHWMNREDAVAVEWMAKHTRNPLPQKIVWRQDDVTHNQSYWLRVDKQNRKGRSEIRASRTGQTIEVSGSKIEKVIVMLNDAMLDLDQPITIKAGGRTSKVNAKRTIGTIARTLDERGDRNLMFSAEVEVGLTKAPKKSTANGSSPTVDTGSRKDTQFPGLTPGATLCRHSVAGLLGEVRFAWNRIVFSPPPSPPLARGGVTVAFAPDGKNANSKNEESKNEKTVPQLAALVRKSVVVVSFTGRDGKTVGLGSGFVISKDGLIATNLHVIGEARPIVVQTADGKKYNVKSIHATEPKVDLAILKIDAKNLTPLPLGDSDTLQQGQRIVALGNPQGLQFSVVAGVVSGKRKIDGKPLIQLAIPIERGNSGGPLLDRQGRVHGILTLKSLVTKNLGFAVTINALKPLIAKPNPVPMKRWLTIGTLDERRWSTLFGGTWRQRAGRISVAGRGSGFGGRVLALSKRTMPKLPFEVGVRVKLGDEAGAAGLAFHADGKTKHYGFYPTNGKLRLSRFEGPDVYSWKVLREVRSEHYRPGEFNALKVRVEKGRLKCFVNDKLVIDSTDTGLTSGRIGLVAFRGTAAEFRRFRIGKQIPSAEPTAKVAEQIAQQVKEINPKRPPGNAVIAKLIPQAGNAETVLRRRAKILEQQAERLRQLARLVHEAQARQKLVALFKQPEDKIDLLKAALLIARIDNEEVDVAGYIAEVNRMVTDVSGRLKKNATEADRIKALDKYLFEEMGFHGSRTNYYNQSNSYMNEVIDDREGLPIVLSVLYMEMARRLKLKVVGVGLPGHFVVRFEPTKGKSQLIDPFDRGKRMSRKEAVDRVKNIAGLKFDDEFLKAQTKKAIVERMLQNLMGLARDKTDAEAMLRYVETLTALNQNSGLHRWFRAVLNYQTKRNREALADVNQLLKDQPKEVDLRQVRGLKRAVEAAIGKDGR